MSTYTERPKPLHGPHTISRDDFTYLERCDGVYPISTIMYEYYLKDGRNPDDISKLCSLVKSWNDTPKTIEQSYKLVDKEIASIKSKCQESQMVWTAIYDYTTGKWNGYHHHHDYNMNYEPLEFDMQKLPKHKEWKDGKHVIEYVDLVPPEYRPEDNIYFSYGGGKNYKGKTYYGKVKYYFADGCGHQYHLSFIGHNSCVHAEDVLGLHSNP